MERPSGEVATLTEARRYRGAASAIAPCDHAGMASPGSSPSLAFGAVSGAANALEDLGALCAELAATSQRIVVPELLPDYGSLANQIAHGALHIAWAPPLVAVELEAARLARPVLCSVRAGGTAYYSALFAASGSALRGLGDLAGQHVAWVDRGSSAGYVLPRLKIAAAGLDPARLFRKESFARTHAGVARAVIGGEADVGATYQSLDPRTKEVLWAGWRDAGATNEDVHVLATAGPIPADAIVLSTRLAPELAESLTDLVRALAKTARPAVKRLLRADGFERVRPAHFDELRRLVAAQRSG
jgi:phosphate/phosphite/phosphonate ABC transporter binding protein